MSNNPDIYKISFGPISNSLIFQNEKGTGSFNFMEENDQIGNEQIGNELISNCPNQNEENEPNFLEMLENYQQKEENKITQNHFVFTAESYNNNFNNNIKENEKKKNNINNINNDINKQNQQRDYLTDEEIKKTCSIKSNLKYTLFQNKYRENACYINVILHFIYSCKNISDYLINLYRTRMNIIKEALNKKLDVDQNDKEALKELEKMKMEELMCYLGEIFYKYSKALKSKNKVNILSTLEFRKKLSIISEKFILNYVADPVEFLIFLLESLFEMIKEQINKIFYLNIRERYSCPNCKEEKEIKYDKTTFVHQIYVEEIFNYLNKHKKVFDDYSEKLFLYSQMNYLNSEILCKNEHQTEKRFICENYPNYLIINCVWEQRPNIDQVLKLFTLLSLKNKLSDLFEVPSYEKNNTNLIYDLTHIILYSFGLCHYIIVTYNPDLNIFNLFDDSKVIESDNFPEIIEMITANLIAQNPLYYFYPVLLIYSNVEIYKDEKIINKNKFEKKFYNKLVERIRNSIQQYEKKLMEKKKMNDKNNNNNKNKNNNININKNEEKIEKQKDKHEQKQETKIDEKKSDINNSNKIE